MRSAHRWPLGGTFTLITSCISEHRVGGTEEQDPCVLNEPALHRMHHGFKPVVGAEFLVDAVKVIS